MKADKITLKSITLLTICTILCYVSLFWNVSIWSPNGTQTIFFGSIVVLLAAINIGGWTAAISGCLGMGLYYMVNGGSAHAPVIFITQFIVGFAIAIIYNLCKNKENLRKTLSYIFGVFLIAVGVVFTFLMIKTGGSYTTTDPSAKFAFHWALVVFPYILGALLIASSFFADKLPELLKFMPTFLIACATMIIVEVFSTFIFSFFFELGNHGFVLSNIVGYLYAIRLFIIDCFICTGLIIVAPGAMFIKDKYENR